MPKRGESPNRGLLPAFERQFAAVEAAYDALEPLASMSGTEIGAQARQARRYLERAFPTIIESRRETS